MRRTRRQLIRVGAVLGVGGTAGCLGGHGRAPRREGDPPPTIGETRYRHWDLDTLDEAVVSGGPDVDGIPSIDRPQFQPANEAEVDDGEVIFGLCWNGEARAYPQRILVYHEIVNDTVDDEPVCVTYCPLTGTVQGFRRGGSTFGVTGSLVNSNLVMYDRGTESWWPQVQGTAIAGDLRGDSLQEFRVYWTTWERWRAVHPDTIVLTEDTGYGRMYWRDPYGSYNPREGYYANGAIPYEILAINGGEHPKEVVIGSRTEAGAIAFNKDRLLSSGILTGTVEETPVVAVRDSALATGYVYENPDGASIEPAGDEYRVDGEVYAPGSLPLRRLLAMDAMWFAWHAYFPSTAYVDG